jgi:PilZ domain-containing protein
VYHLLVRGEQQASSVRIPQEKVAALARSKERRRFRRVRIDLAGRYMLTDGREYPCQVVDMSAGGLGLTTPLAGKVGERVVLYLDHIGRLEGVIARVYPTGFAVKVAATARKRDKLAAQLTWLANRHSLGSPEDREHARITPTNTRAEIVLPDGTSVTCRLLNMSLSGAAMVSDHKPVVGTLIRLGNAEARVVRVSEDGFAVEFTRPQAPDFLRRHGIEDRATTSPLHGS